MNTLQAHVNQLPAEDNLLFTWQFSLSRRLCQIMEANSLTQTEFAVMVGISEQELDDLIHFAADPPLSLMARIAALSKSDILTWVNSDG
ncbi:MAG: helix-turn-helix transcriptional regulator [Candidatus Kapabacteria bacterium]|nr:helix-turn-helix transcriptional regulator [Candidatus Kapabacteria bacterium]